MPFTPTTWTDGVTAANSAHLTNTDTQYTEAINSFEQDLFTAFVLSGGIATKDGSVANQLDVTQCKYLALQTDSSLRRRVVNAANYITSTPSTTYYLDFNPDQSVSWGTSHSAVANHLTICSVTTDGSGNIATVTDARSLTITFFPNAAGVIQTLAILSAQAGLSLDHTPFNGETADSLLIYGQSGGAGTQADVHHKNLTGGWIYHDMLNASGHVDLNARLNYPSILLGSGAQINAISFFSGSGAGTFNHGLGRTPQWVGITENVLNATMTVGVDTIGSTTVHVNTGTSSAWIGLAIG